MKQVQPFLSALCFALVSALVVLIAATPSSLASERRHGLSIFGDLKYPPDFQHFDYVNPDAPKGGSMALIGEGSLITFDSFNGYILKGNPAQELDLLFDTLMARAFDEPDAVYGRLAYSAEVADDRRSVTFYLRPEARFADGTPVTSADVAFSILTLKEKGHPIYALPLRDVVKAETPDEHTVCFEFQGENLRDLPVIIAQMPVFSKAYYEKHPFDKSTLEPPLGSGPYKISDFKQGTYVVFKRRKDYWAKDLPVMRGMYNFDELRYEYYRDRTAELEALKAGAYDFREEFTSKTWATEYNIPQVTSGKIKLMTTPDGRMGGTQGWFINTRREKFADPRLREALDYAFDFEWSNKNLFYGLYKRTESYFENSDLKAEGLPSPEELALLEPYRDKLPPEVFGEAYRPPRTDGTGNRRDNLLKAAKLLDESGWTITKQEQSTADCGFFCRLGRLAGFGPPLQLVRKNAKGETLTVEFLIDDPVFERVLGPYARNLAFIGVDVQLRRVDAAELEERRKKFDYDIILSRMIMPQTPGLEIRNFWTSASADAYGSNNLAGIKDPVIDVLTDKMLNAKSRDELRVVARALDRILRAKHYWVSNWYKDVHNLAFWDKFSWPQVTPPYSRAVIETWWYDSAKASALAQQQR